MGARDVLEVFSRGISERQQQRQSETQMALAVMQFEAEKTERARAAEMARQKLARENATIVLESTKTDVTQIVTEETDLFVEHLDGLGGQRMQIGVVDGPDGNVDAWYKKALEVFGEENKDFADEAFNIVRAYKDPNATEASRQVARKMASNLADRLNKSYMASEQARIEYNEENPDKPKESIEFTGELSAFYKAGLFGGKVTNASEKAAQLQQGLSIINTISSGKQNLRNINTEINEFAQGDYEIQSDINSAFQAQSGDLYDFSYPAPTTPLPEDVDEFEHTQFAERRDKYMDARKEALDKIGPASFGVGHDIGYKIDDWLGGLVGVPDLGETKKRELRFKNKKDRKDFFEALDNLEKARQEYVDVGGNAPIESALPSHSAWTTALAKEGQDYMRTLDNE